MEPDVRDRRAVPSPAPAHVLSSLGSLALGPSIPRSPVDPAPPRAASMRGKRRRPRRSLAAALLSLVPLGACAGPSRGAPAGEAGAGARAVAPESVSAACREALVAWRAGGAQWERGREGWLDDPAVAAFLVDNWIVALVRAFSRGELAAAGDPPGTFERARAALLREHERSAPVLVELLAVADGVVAGLAADLLVEIDDPQIAPRVARLLAREESEARRRAAELLARLAHAREREPEVRSALSQALAGDPEWIVRAQAARSLGARAVRDSEIDLARRSLTAALGDRDPAVAREAARALGALGDPRAFPALVNHLERLARRGGGPRELAAAQGALERLAGPLPAGETPPRTPAEWRRFWERHGARSGGATVPSDAGRP